MLALAGGGRDRLSRFGGAPMPAPPLDQRERIGSPPRRLLDRWRAAFAADELEAIDREPEIIRNRLIFSLLILGYVTLFVPGHTRATALVAYIYAALGLVVFADRKLRPARSTGRRLFAMGLDIGALSVELHIGGAELAVLYPIYLWIIFGNGFRYGVAHLFAATAIGFLGFAAVVATTPAWQAELAMSLGLLGGQVILPIYASTLIRKLSEAKREAEKANQAKSLFLASVSHELRTPLNAIIGMAHLLADTSINAEQRDMVRTVRAAATSLLGLINGLLDFSRIEAGRMPVNLADFALLDLLTEIRGLVTAQARSKALELALHVTARTPLALRGDRRHLHEILLNLVGNAVKFTAEGGVVLGVDAAEVGPGRARLTFEVTDTGIGIAPEARQRIFESFTQADSSIVDRFGGTGLGLAICKRLVGLLGGEIGVDSAIGVGSTFWFTVPVEVRAEPATPLSGVHIGLLGLGPHRAAIEQALAGEGASIVPAETMAEALRQAGAARTHGAGCVVLVAPRALPGGEEALAPGLFAAQTALSVPLVRVGETRPAGLPALAERRRFVSALPLPIDATGLRRVLSIALTGANGGAPSSPSELAEAADAPGPGRPLTVLLADDNRTNQKVIAKILERAGHRVHLADNGEMALDALEAEPFDVVLMDVNMPVMSGIEATKLYRFTALDQPRVPIVALTADATPDAAKRCADAGMDACLTKPIEPAVLLATIAALAGGETAPAPAGEVREIASHPRFRPAAHGPIDERMLKDLETLGGSAFLADLIDQFLADAEALLGEMAAAVAAGDVQQFRSEAHALRSCAANIGAKALFELCLGWRMIRAQELASDGAEHMRRLRAEFERIRAALLRHRAGLQVVGGQR